jgi:thioredoxin reductase (NADPH)
MMERELVILGGGPAGLTAAIYAARAGIKPLIIEGKMPGGQLMGTTYVENWPGDKQILGPRLMIEMREHAAHFGAEFLGEEIIEAQLKQQPFSLTTNSGLVIKAKCLIIATGATYKRLGCPGEDEYWGKGVTTCAVCDGAFYKDKKVIIVGGGDTAMEDASFMTNFTKDITIVHILDKLTASHAMQERILKNKDIKIIYSSTVSLIEGDGNHVTHATITDQITGKTEKTNVDALFIAIGLKPNTGIFVNQLDLNPYGYILQKEHTQTSIPGVFAAGDVVDFRYRQAITSAGSGCMAALDAERYLKGL